MNESTSGKVATSFSKRNWLKILCVILGISVIVLGALLYNTSRLFYYEQNVSKYAKWERYTAIENGFSYLEWLIRNNKTLLALEITDIARDARDAARAMQIMDGLAHYEIWKNIYYASDWLNILSESPRGNYFPDGWKDAPPDQVYQYISDLDASLSQAVTEAGYTMGESLYNPGANRLKWNEEMLQNAGQTAKNLGDLLFDIF